MRPVYQTISLSSAFAAIVAAIDCDYFSIYNTPGGWFGIGAQAITLASDPYDQLQQIPLLPGLVEELLTPPRPFSSTRFRQGELLLYGKADSGSADVILRCWS